MKIEKQVLNRKQMAHLVELGVDTSDASMYWSYENSCGDGYWVLLPYDKNYGIDEETIPAYTINDLIEKLLKRNDKGNCFNIKLSDETISYVYTDVFVYCATYNNLIDGLYDCLCRVAETHIELIN